MTTFPFGRNKREAQIPAPRELSNSTQKLSAFHLGNSIAHFCAKRVADLKVRLQAEARSTLGR